MDEQKKKKNISIGLLAHVDAGKTTLAESMLYASGRIRKLGRVDHKDTFFDTERLERARGITIFSKQATLQIGEKNITLLDTPGHVDFSAEMERTLQVLDYGILIISGADGIQGHVETLWRLLEEYQIPTFLFINKMDQPGTEKEQLLQELQKRLSENCICFSYDKNNPEATEEFLESLAMCHEQVMENYLETGEITKEEIVSCIQQRKVFPCYFGSALKLIGMEEFQKGLSDYIEYPDYPEDFGARVFKISRDAQGNRLTHMKITGGHLKVKTLLKGHNQSWEEKADQIRIYSGTGYEMVSQVGAGTICAVTGLTKTFPGEGIGAEKITNLPLLVPVLNYRLNLPKDCSVTTALQQLRMLQEEEPLLHIVWQEEVGEIHIQLMGEVQIEVLKSVIEERFHMNVEFDKGSIVYKETLLEPVDGVGHYEPLRHYAEVYLYMEPGELGSGMQFFSDCSEDVLDGNWQRLILTHLEEKAHKGVLTGSEITDVRITLVAGKSHLKHTEGGDFRQATYRAVRQGLKMGKCCLLEPVYEYRLLLPEEMVGRAMIDLQNMHGTFQGPEPYGEMVLLTGTAPVATMQGYQKQVLSYTKGKGQLSCRLQGYAPCYNQEEVVEKIGYDSEHDLENPTGSVFCAHGAGFVVPYYQVYDYMHLERQKTKNIDTFFLEQEESDKNSSNILQEAFISEEEIHQILQKAGGTRKESTPQKKWHGKKKMEQEKRAISYSQTSQTLSAVKSEKEYLLVDGYNIIFGWKELKELASIDMGGARGRLMDILSNYQGYKKNIVILVFDAYKVEGNPGSQEIYQNIHVVYTKEAETADSYIEKVTQEIGKKHKVIVATSDGLEQVIILGQGARRMSASDLQKEVEEINSQIRFELQNNSPKGAGNYLFQDLPQELADQMEAVRLGKKTDFSFPTLKKQ